MHENTHPLNRLLLSASRRAKKSMMILSDLLVLPFALWSAFALRVSDWWPSEFLEPAVSLFVATPLFGVAALLYFGLYRAVVRYMTLQAVMQVLKGVGITALSLYIWVTVFNIEPFPRSVPLIFTLVALLYVGGTRLLVRSYYNWLVTNFMNANPVIIYGAGESGVRVHGVLRGNGEYNPVAFIDDNKRLQGSVVAGLQVYSPDELSELTGDWQIKTVLLALPEVSGSRRKEIISHLTDLNLHVITVPAVTELLSGRALESLREVEIEDLLGRDPVPPKQELIDASITNKVVMITGAGGSIGSEITRQAVMAGARKLVLLESSEYNLYKIEQDITALKMREDLNVELILLLGSVLERTYLERVLEQFGVDTIYHAAAYKHVPLVEHNIVSGVRNNVFGTQAVLQAAIAQKVSRFILISTDKAVRPTNVMGASKRLAEMLVQNAQFQSSNTICSMVRFGNVLGSSGSVVPLFKSQIAAGGPVTVTHPEITRYFMTIQEAASLVVQAGSMARGGEVFLLDMGEPVKVAELAQTMIRLSGKSLKDASNPHGDVEIKFTGLRPGEKLYEELLIGDAEEGTEHPKILKAHEQTLSQEALEDLLVQLQASVERLDSAAVKSLLTTAVAGYLPAEKDVDWSLSASNFYTTGSDSMPPSIKH